MSAPAKVTEPTSRRRAGVQVALATLGFERVRIHPPRFGRGWPARAKIESRFRALAKRYHPDAGGGPDGGGGPDEFRRVKWAVEVLRRYRPPDEYRADG